MRKMSRTRQDSVRLWRIILVVLVLLAGLSGLLWRLVSLTIANRDFLQDQGDARAQRAISDRAPRGVIYDRQGVPLAITAPVYSVWVDPAKSDLSLHDLGQISQVLNVPTDALRHRYHAHKKQRFMYVQRDVQPKLALKIKALKLGGVYLLREGKRYYPEGEVMAHIVGAADVDEHGVEGLERYYDAQLRGVQGLREVVKDRLGRVIADRRLIRAAQKGEDLQLSLDHRMQYIAYRELQAGVLKSGAKSGSAVLIDVKTGEVLAMVNAPSFNPNAHGVQNMGAHRNRALTDMLEPGSTIKPLSVANALRSEKFNPDTPIDTNPGILWLNGHKVIDENINHGVISVSDVLIKSSNIGIAKMTLALPANSLWETLDRFGFGQPTGLGFPGESSGKLDMPHKWSDFALATLSFGYGLAVTPAQMARAYAAIANGGVLLPLSLLKLDHAPEGVRVLSEERSHQLINMMSQVTDFGGTGWRASIPGYQVAGKTGTSMIAGKHGYAEKRYMSSFVGLAPIDDPQFVLVVMIVEPDPKRHYGGLVAAPIFAKIIASVLNIWYETHGGLPFGAQ